MLKSVDVAELCSLEAERPRSEIEPQPQPWRSHRFALLRYARACVADCR